MPAVATAYETIAAGPGGSCGLAGTGTTSVNCSVPLASVVAGDVFVAWTSGRATSGISFSGFCGVQPQFAGNPANNANQTAWIASNLPNCPEALSVASGTAATANHFALLTRIYRGCEVGHVAMNPDGTSVTGTGLVTAPFTVNVTRPGAWVVSAWYVTTQAATITAPTMRTNFSLTGGRTLLMDDVVNQVGPYAPWLDFTGASWICRWAVVLEPKEILVLPTATLSASPQTINRGQSSTLTWQTTDATNVTIVGIGSVQLSGSSVVTPTYSATYYLTASGPGGQAQASATVTVIQPPPPELGDAQRLATGLFLFRLPVKIPLEE